MSAWVGGTNRFTSLSHRSPPSLSALTSRYAGGRGGAAEVRCGARRKWRPPSLFAAKTSCAYRILGEALIANSWDTKNRGKPVCAERAVPRARETEGSLASCVTASATEQQLWYWLPITGGNIMLIRWHYGDGNETTTEQTTRPLEVCVCNTIWVLKTGKGLIVASCLNKVCSALNWRHLWHFTPTFVRLYHLLCTH